MTRPVIPPADLLPGSTCHAVESAKNSGAAFYSATRPNRQPERVGCVTGAALRRASGVSRAGLTHTPEVLPALTSPLLDLPPAEAGGPFLADAITITLPWPPAIVHQNKRPNRYAKAAATKAYRKACADAAYNAGISPLERWTLSAVTFCPPDKRKRDQDGMIGAFKAGQDGLADAAGADDGDFRPTYSHDAPRPGGAIVVTMSLIPIPG